MSEQDKNKIRQKYLKSVAATGSFDMDVHHTLLSQLFLTLDIENGKSDETVGQRLRAAMAVLREIGPLDVVEGMLGVQMAATHNTAMDCLRRAAVPDVSDDVRDRNLKSATKLLKLYMEQVDALRRKRSKGVVTVQVTSDGSAPKRVVRHTGQWDNFPAKELLILLGSETAESFDEKISKDSSEYEALSSLIKGPGPTDKDEPQ